MTRKTLGICRFALVPLIVAATVNFCGAATGDEISDSVTNAMKHIRISHGEKSLCVITDASYVMMNGHTTERYLDVIGEKTGCSIGKGNLLLFHRPTTGVLKIALFDKKSWKCSVVEVDGSKAVLHGPVSLAFDRLNDDSAWKEIQEVIGEADAFTITGIAHQWAAGAPFDFLKCAELHNHLCAGITSGYFIVKYIQKNYPLREGESYTYISCPPWCKDDGIQMLMDLTPGKHGMFVAALSKEQLARVSDSNVAGVMLVRHGKHAGATALILSYDQNAANEVSGSLKFSGRQASITTLTGLVPFYGSPERFVHVLKKLEIAAGTADSLGMAGINPYEVLGFVK